MTHKVSHPARILAKQHDINTDDIIGTGHKGLVTKFDVQALIDKSVRQEEKSTSGPKNPPIEINKEVFDYVTTKTVEAQDPTDQPEVLAEVPAVPESGVVLPSQEEMAQIIFGLQEKIGELENQQQKLISRDDFDRDLMDDMYFIHKPYGRRWTERRVVNKKTITIEQTGSAFFGPFKDEAMIDIYLEAKSEKRIDSYIDWANCSVVKGKDARRMDREEEEQRQAAFNDNSVPVNILDRRIWASQQDSYAEQGQGQGKLLGRQEGDYVHVPVRA